MHLLVAVAVFLDLLSCSSLAAHRNLVAVEEKALLERPLTRPRRRPFHVTTDTVQMTTRSWNNQRSIGEIFAQCRHVANCKSHRRARRVMSRSVTSWVSVLQLVLKRAQTRCTKTEINKGSRYLPIRPDGTRLGAFFEFRGER